MSRDYRREVLKRLPARVKERCTLTELDREYRLSEIAIITRGSPAKMLGLPHKGHLGSGADADITVYTPQSDRRAMFELPRYVFKAGELIVEQGEIRRVPFGPMICAEPKYDAGALPHIREWFEANYSMAFANFPVGEEYLSQGKVAVTP